MSGGPVHAQPSGVRFVRQSVTDAVRLVASSPPDLIVTVAAIFIAGTLVSATPTLWPLGFVLNFAGSTLLAAGLLGRPTPDGLAGATARLRRRLAPAVRQLFVVVLLYVALVLALAIAVAVVATAIVPGLTGALQTATVNDPTLQAVALAMVLPSLIAVLVITARLLPSVGLVLDQEVGAVASLRMSWASTRRRTLACTALLFVGLTPNIVLAVILPPDVAAILSIFAIVAEVAIGVAAYRVLFPTSPTPASAAPVLDGAA